MRVLMLSSSYPKFPGDGTAPFIERIVMEVARRGHAVDLVLPRHPDLVTRGRSDSLPLRFFPFYAGPRKLYAWGYASSMQADTRLRAMAVAVAPVAIVSGLVALLRRIARESYDLVHAHWALPNGPIAALAASRARLPLVVSLHGSDVFVAERSALLRALATRVLRASRWTHACSRDLAERARSLAGLPQPPDVLPYGVDLAEFAGGDPGIWRRRSGAGSEDFLVVGLGRLVAKKGFVNLIGATARLHAENSRVRLALGGKGDLAEALATRARDEGCAEVVCLLGDVPHDEVGALLGAADVVVVPSIRDDRGNVDGLPNVLLESMAAGRPVIASRVGGIPDVIESERNGLLVEPGDVDALAAAIRRLRESAALRIALGAGAAATARSLSWPAYGERLLAGYRRAISGKPS